MAAPEQPPSRRPSQVGYWIGGAVALAGLLAGVALLVSSFGGLVGKLGQLERLDVPGRTELDLPAGKHVVYVESTQGSPPAGLVEVRVAPVSSGTPIALRPYATSFTYTSGGRSGRAVHTFTTPARARYAIASSGPSAAGLTVAVGPALGGTLAGTLRGAFGGFGLLFGGPAAGGLIAFVTGIRRHRARPRSAPAAGPPPPGPGWYPDPSGAGGWRWWDGQRWTGHTG